MNERLRELAEQSGLSREFSISGLWLADDEELERFAQLVRDDLIVMYKQALTDSENQPSQYGTVTVQHMEQQITAEREACAKLCESMGVHPALNVWNGGPDWYKRQKECAAAIRARKESV